MRKNENRDDNSSKKQKFNLGDVVYMVKKPKQYAQTTRLASIDKQEISFIGVNDGKIIYNSLSLEDPFYEEDVFLCKDEAFEILTEMNMSTVLKHNSSSLKLAEKEFNKEQERKNGTR